MSESTSPEIEAMAEAYRLKQMRELLENLLVIVQVKGADGRLRKIKCGLVPKDPYTVPIEVPGRDGMPATTYYAAPEVLVE